MWNLFFYLKDRTSTDNVREMSLEEKNVELRGILGKQQALVDTERILRYCYRSFSNIQYIRNKCTH